ncbi:hypothetical protein B7R78_0000350 [Ralstonia solanacearum]|nr:hypothetical protein [Ralstonia solanacearum]RIJ86033.1 hypothetical protein RSP822_12650 [Ralstonia solanacearum]
MIPDCLIGYMVSPSMELSEVKIKRFLERTGYVFEVCEKIEEWLSIRDQTAFALLNDVDLDINVVLGSNFGGDGGDSTWLIHDSWASEMSTAAMYESIPKEVTAFLCEGFSRFQLSEPEVDHWVMSWTRSLRSVLDAYRASVTADDAMGRVLAMDLLLQKMLCFITILRFNTLIERY